MLEKRFIAVRKKTTALCECLETEDYVVQPIPEVSPPKWHLAHTTWLLEELILNKKIKNYKFFNDGFRKLFNSYYKSLGEHWPQKDRGKLSRPTVVEVAQYRKVVEDQVLDVFLKNKSDKNLSQILELAINHEEQHQELLLMDIKNILATNPLLPAYQNNRPMLLEKSNERWLSFPEGVYEIGARGDEFYFDNEAPRHKVYLNDFSLSDHLVTNGEYLNFIHDSGYERPSLWLSMGWDWVRASNANAPLYWINKNDMWKEFTLYGEGPLDLNAPVSHVNYFEADAFAKWMGMRLPSEAEFELCELEYGGKKENSSEIFHPTNPGAFNSQLWCWTKNHYSAYPGFVPFSGEVEEYNGKFMCNQFVLKGGCFATPPGHYRISYRNFYEPHQRWMFSGIALARDKS